MATIELTSRVVRIWNLQTGTSRKLGEVPCPSEAFFADCDHFVTIPNSDFRRSSEFPPVLIWNVLQGGATSFRAGLIDRLDSTPISESHPWLVTRSPNSDLIREFWDPRSLKLVGSKLLPDPYELFRSPNGQHHLIGDGHGSYELWNRRVDRKLAVLGSIARWAFSPDGKSLFTFGNSLQRIDLRTGKTLWPSVVDREPSPPSGIRWYENSSRLLVGENDNDSSFAYYDLSTGQRLDLFELPELRSIASEEKLNLHVRFAITFRKSDEASIDDRVFRKDQEWVVRPNFSAIPVLEGGTRVPRNISPRGDLLVVHESGSEMNASRQSDVNTQEDDGDLVVWERITGDQIFRLRQPGRGMIAFHPSERFVACVCEDGIRIWDLSNGNLVRQFDGYDFDLPDSGRPRFISFSPDGKKLASEHVDSAILIWNVSDLPTPPKVRLSPEEIERLWLSLRHGRGTEANAAIWKLAGSPETVLPFLRENLQPVREFTPKDFASLLPDLLDPFNFRRRETTLRKLEEMSDAVVPCLRDVLDDDFDDPQLSRRLGLIVKSRFWDTRPSGVELQSMRAIRLLELIGGQEALKQMEKLSQGLGMSRSTIEAIAAKARMKAK